MREEIVFTIVIFAGVCAGGTITVNWDGTGDYMTIQEGIYAAVDGDTVIVEKGIYSENILFLGSNIVLMSTRTGSKDEKSNCAKCMMRLLGSVLL